ALRVALTPQEAASLGQNRPEDVRAYDLYLKGRERYGHYNEAALREALSLFEQAIALDPGYALAYAGLADSHGQLVQWSGDADPKEHLRLGLEAAKKAIELNPRLPEAYKSHALVLRFAGDHAAARTELLKGLEADPRHTPTLINLCVDAFTIADLAGAERGARRALDADPQEAFALLWIASLTLFTGRYEETIAVAQRVRKASDSPFYTGGSYSLRMMVDLKRGDTTRIVTMTREAIAAGAEPIVFQPYVALAALIDGRVDEARRILGELAQVPQLGFGQLLTAASLALRLGDPAAATQFMSRPIALAIAPTTIRIESDLMALADVPAFAPRRMDQALVWPLEAPMIDAARFRLFREMKVESGLPER
ncbi:MAG: hypothetical protein ABI960_07205, partial [Candidatus Eisenbacteria bacterium]